MLTTKDNRPATYQTTWDELSDASQQALLSLEAKVLECRDAARVLNENDRLSADALDARQKRATENSSSIAATFAALRGRLDADVGDAHAVADAIVAQQRATDAVLRTLTRAQQRRDGLQAAAASAVAGGAALPPPGYRESAQPSDWLPKEVARLEEGAGRCSAALAGLEKELAAAQAPGAAAKDATVRRDAAAFAAALRQSAEFLVHVAATAGVSPSAHLESRRAMVPFAAARCNAQRSS